MRFDAQMGYRHTDSPLDINGVEWSTRFEFAYRF
jgi:hypothetical protein